jgi:anti-sigma factor RsiW
MSDCSFIDPLVTPYVDGELPGADREAVAQHLRACPPCRARVIIEQAVRDLVHARKPSLQRDRASDLLRAKCAAQSERSIAGGRGAAASAPGGTVAARWRTLAPLTLASTLVLVAGASLYRITEKSTHVMAAELAADHVKCFLLQDLIGAEQPVGPVEYALASKFGWSAHLPERPDRAALELLGERTCLYGQGRVAHIMYRHEGRPVSLFMLPNDTRKEEVLETLGHGAAVWSVGSRTFVLIAREPKADFERMALFVRAGLH